MFDTAAILFIIYACVIACVILCFLIMFVAVISCTIVGITIGLLINALGTKYSYKSLEKIGSSITKYFWGILTNILDKLSEL